MTIMITEQQYEDMAEALGLPPFAKTGATWRTLLERARYLNSFGPIEVGCRVQILAVGEGRVCAVEGEFAWVAKDKESGYPYMTVPISHLRKLRA